MSTIYISTAHKDLAERLARNPTSIGQRPIFSTYMHLMVFAAMVGYSVKRAEAVESKDRGPEIYEDVFERNKLDGLAFLVALDMEKSGDILRDTRDAECWRIIEGYAEAGFQVVQQWLLNQPGDADGVETILSRMSESASERLKEAAEPLSPDVEF